MFTTSQLQLLQSNIRAVIRTIQDDLIAAKAMKRHYDETEQLDAEYAMHNQVVQMRKDLKKWVALQKSCKNTLKEEFESAAEQRFYDTM